MRRSPTAWCKGASVVRRLLERGPDAVGDYVAEVRAAIDESADDG